MALKPIPSLPAYYATEDGRIFKYRKKDDNLFELSQNSVSNSGYRLVQPYKDGKKLLKYVHQLVLEAFVGPRPEYMQCDHINRDKLDNNISNLRYISQSANLKNRGSWKKEKQNFIPIYKKYSERIAELRNKGMKPSVIAEELNVPVKTVYYASYYLQQK